MNISLESIGITREEILSLAASKLVDQITQGDECAAASVEHEAQKQIQEIVKSHAAKKVEAVLSAHMDEILKKEFVPVNLWGEPTAKPTTIREQLEVRARDYWSTKVDSSGNPGDYYSNKTRAEWLFGKLVATEFSNAVAQNVTNIVGALKDALTKEAQESVLKHINSIIQVKTK